MKKSRREFLKLSAVGAVGLSINACASSNDETNQIVRSSTPLPSDSSNTIKPVVVSTWKHGLKANEAAWEVLNQNGYALDAVEKGVMVSELDEEERSVGVGGRPDREGKVTLDACIMNESYDCGSVAFLQNIATPIAVARKVMEETPHVMLSGSGAEQFAYEQGFKKTELLTEASRQEWAQWLLSSKYEPVINIENHDTIGMLALDNNGKLSGACTTSGAAYKLHGRVGDSPIIGAGLYVDGEVGAACATGLGEAVIRVCGSHLVVQLMKQGYSPEEACQEAVVHLHKVHKNRLEGLQVGFLGLNLNGESGAYSMYNGFNYARYDQANNRMIDAASKLTWD